MDGVVSAVAERLVAENPQAPPTVVVRLVEECANQFPYCELLIEQACEARLALFRTQLESDWQDVVAGEPARSPHLAMSSDQ